MTDHLATETLIDYLHHELPPADDARVYAHLADCEPCAAELETERSLSDALHAAAAEDERELPSLVKAGIWERVRSDRPRVRWWETLLRPALAVPVGAAIVIGALVSYPALQQSSGPRIGAAYYLQQHDSSRANPLTERGPQPAVLLEESDASAPSASFAALMSSTQPQNPLDR